LSILPKFIAFIPFLLISKPRTHTPVSAPSAFA
jgi:hypothetical protein